MITSMTGFGRGEARKDGFSVTVEVRSVNSRYLEISSNLPKKYHYKDLEMREIVKEKSSRGKIGIGYDIQSTGGTSAPTALNAAAVEGYHLAMLEIKKQLKLKDPIKLEHILQCPDVFKTNVADDKTEAEWAIIAEALKTALDGLNAMRLKEGRELSRDIHGRMKNIEKNLDKIEQVGIERVPQERQRLRERIAKLFESDEIDEQRLEMEIVLLADKIDISEECVRFRSHIKFFFELLRSTEQAGRKINFLLQEMHREVNTIGSKANDPDIAHLVVGVKEELEKIREQIQNVE